jgi:glycerol uptake operon antiterminator
MRQIIAAVRSFKEIDKGIRAGVDTFFILECTLSQMKDIAQIMREHNKVWFLHIDLVKGLKEEEAAIEYLFREIKPTGIITVRKSLIPIARAHSLRTILRFFAIDSVSLRNIVKTAQEVKPDYVEVLPGIVPKVITILHEQLEPFGIKIITGGLVDQMSEVRAVIAAGAQFVSVGNKDLWQATIDN